MTSIRARLLASLLGLLALAALLMGAVAYRNVLAEAETIFDYQLQQMALSLRDQGEISAAQVDSITDGQLDFVIQIWTVDGRSIYASRPHASLPARALLGLATLNVDGRAWRTYSVATRERVIQVAQPIEIRRRLAAHAAWRSVAAAAADGAARRRWRSGGWRPSTWRRCPAWPASCAAATPARSRRSRPAPCRTSWRRWRIRSMPCSSGCASRSTRSAPSSPTRRTSCARRLPP